MPEYPKLTVKDAANLLLAKGFVLDRQKGSHQIYAKGALRQVVPFHSGKTLHPKIVKQIFETISKA